MKRSLACVLGLVFGVTAGAACDPDAEEMTQEEFAEAFDEGYCGWYRECEMGCSLNGHGMADKGCTFHPDKAEECLEAVEEGFGGRSCGLSPPDIGFVYANEVLTDCDPNNEQD